MAYETLIVEREDGIGIISLNRPPANPVNYTLLDELGKALAELEEDKTVRALIITGAGEKAFSAGFDIKTFGTPEGEKTGPKGHEVFSRIERCPKPVVAAINGFALGGGCELSLACHFRIMVDSERAVIGLSEIDLGIIPGWGGTQRLPRLVGKAKGLEMILLGKRIGAPEALSITPPCGILLLSGFGAAAAAKGCDVQKFLTTLGGVLKVPVCFFLVLSGVLISRFHWGKTGRTE